MDSLCRLFIFLGLFMTEKNKIYLLSGIIVFVCVLILGLNFLLNYMDNHPSSSSDEIENTEIGEVGGMEEEDDYSAFKSEKGFDENPFENLGQIDKFNESSVADGRGGAETDGMAEKPVHEEKTPEKKSAVSDSAFVDPDSRKVRPSPFKIPEAKNGATLYFVFDDGGHNVENLEKYMNLPFPFAVSILPGVARSAECAALVRKNGKELMLHQPMQAENLELSPGPRAITAMMGTKEIVQLVSDNIDSLGGGVMGLNNHEGSLITSNIIKIGAVLEVCKARKIYFLDSKTTARSKAYQAGLELDTAVLLRSAPFLDNEVDRDSILTRIYESLDYANVHEKAIIIGHVDKSSGIIPELLSEMYPELLLAGYKFDVPSRINAK